MKTNVNLSKILTLEELQWFGQWLSKSQMKPVRVPPSWNSLNAWHAPNAAEDLTPTEFAAVTPDGYAVFGQPFVTGQAVSDKNASFALDSVGLKLITQMGGTAAVGQVDDKLVLFDDLHGRNVKVAPNGRVEVIDAINRELTSGEAKKLREWRKLPAELVK